MKLLNDFFKILDTTVNESGFFSRIVLNAGHIVYSSHFPGYPVTPGVIQIQIVHELLENQFGRKLKLKTLSQSKFLKILNPNETSQLIIHIEFEEEEGLINVRAWGENSTDIFFKLSSSYQF